jgi:hypothetical protein
VNAVTVLHEPQLDTILMVEKAILDAEDYPTKTQLWRNLPRKIQYQTFKRVLDYLEASHKIIYAPDGAILWVAADSPGLKHLIETSVRLK